MGRLIDADKLKNELSNGDVLWYLDRTCSSKSDFASLIEIIDEQPTAFNAEKVVEAMEKESINIMLPNGFREPCVTLKTAETIVKAGGQQYRPA